ncbi:MAG: DedA family protein [Atopobiaceae bacterium]
MQAAMLSLISQFGYLALAALVFLENVFPPIPSEVILPAAGFLASMGTMSLPVAIVAATVGSLLGAYVLFGIGKVLSEERLTKLMSSKPMHMLGFEEGDVQSAIGWFRRHGVITVLACRCVPIVRSLISIPAGTSNMGILKFSVYTALGSLVWNTVLCSVGFFAGSAWEQASFDASNAIDVATLVVIAAALVVAAVWIFRRVIPSIKAAVRAEGSE